MLGRAPPKTTDVALDLGSTHVRLVVKGRPEPFEVATAVAIQSSDAGRQATAFGAEARRMQGRTAGNVKIVQPVRGGVIDDYEATGHLLRHLLAEAPARRPWGPSALIAVPFEASEAERRALQECARSAGIREVHLIDAALATALGAQLPLLSPVGSMVVSVGGGRAEVAVHSLGGVVVRRTSRVAGDELDRRISQWLRRTQHLMIGEPTAERIKIDVGAASRDAAPRQIRVRGRDLSSGAAKAVDVSSDDVASAVEAGITHLRDLVLEVLAATPPELCADILASGVILAGGASQLRGLETVLSEATGLPFLRSELGGRCVARGLGAVLDAPELFTRLVEV
jgi:rod shape-determining protein MreB